MPRYDYRCTECGREVEVMHGIHDSGPEQCESCGGAMRKALSPPAIHFKGSGWAKKDASASAKKAKPEGGASPTSPPAETGETKPATASSDGSKAAGDDKSPGGESSITPTPSAGSGSKAG